MGAGLTNPEWVAALMAVFCCLGSVGAFIWKGGQFTRSFDSHQEADKQAFSALERAQQEHREDMQDLMRELKNDLKGRLDGIASEVSQLRGHLLRSRDE
jgi:hypothetical protein